jgi:hypothetical protein
MLLGLGSRRKDFKRLDEYLGCLAFRGLVGPGDGDGEDPIRIHDGSRSEGLAPLECSAVQCGELARAVEEFTSLRGFATTPSEPALKEVTEKFVARSKRLAFGSRYRRYRVKRAVCECGEVVDLSTFRQILGKRIDFGARWKLNCESMLLHSVFRWRARRRLRLVLLRQECPHGQASTDEQDADNDRPGTCHVPVTQMRCSRPCGNDVGSWFVTSSPSPCRG